MRKVCAAVVGVAVVCALALTIPPILAWGSDRSPHLKGDVKPGRGRPRTLVVLVHGATSGSESLKGVERLAREVNPDADFYVPDYPAGLFSNANPYQIADELERNIERFDQDNHYQRITLVGFSVGSLLVRKAFLWGTDDGSFRDRPSHGAPRATWSGKVDRIVLLAGTNRGWSLDTRAPNMPLWKYWGATTAAALARLTGTARLFRGVEYGAPFVADLRVQWIRYVRPRGNSGAPPAVPLVVQLVGTVDDVVLRSDNEDAAASKDFVYIPVEATGHASILRVGDPAGGPAVRTRTDLLRAALADDAASLRSQHPYVMEEHPEVERVVLVVHGIRDLGYWSADLRSEIRKIAGAERVEVKPPGYGWFSMGQFLLWPSRQANVRRFMNDYTDVVARYPKARVSFIGHSNGTYILASALERYVSLEIDRAVLAGSVIPSDFDWERFTDVRSATVGTMRNIVAADDLVLALFPHFFELLRRVPFLRHSRALDIGAAGFLGFRRENPGRYENVEFVTGGHGAFIDRGHPERARALATYIVNGDERALGTFRSAHDPVGWVSIASRLCWAVWLALAGLLYGGGVLLVRLVRARGWRRAAVAAVYATVVWLLLATV